MGFAGAAPTLGTSGVTGIGPKSIAGLPTSPGGSLEDERKAYIEDLERRAASFTPSGARKTPRDIELFQSGMSAEEIYNKRLETQSEQLAQNPGRPVPRAVLEYRDESLAKEEEAAALAARNAELDAQRKANNDAAAKARRRKGMASTIRTSSRGILG